MILNNNGVIRGKYVYLRSVTVKDAEFICKLRNDKDKNQYVHAVSTNVNLQKEWIQKQIIRKNDYYFVICDLQDKPIGLASVYDVNTKNGSGEFGRWISWGNAIQNVESVILAFDFAFSELQLDYVYMRTMVNNKMVRNFWKSFGAESMGEVYEMDLWLEKTIVSRYNYENSLRQKNARLLKY